MTSSRAIFGLIKSAICSTQASVLEYFLEIIRIIELFSLFARPVAALDTARARTLLELAGSEASWATV